MNNTKSDKCFLHLDGDAFFVSVEVAKNPTLKGLAVVTGQERGIVTALSYEAKALGVVRGLPTAKVKKTWPQVIILPGDYKSYVKYSMAMFNIVRRYVDEVEEYSIDECFADLTGYDKLNKCSYFELATKIKQDIVQELALSVSIGLAPTKVLAKVASKWQKPDGLTVIEHNFITDFLKKTILGKVWGIGPKTVLKLNQLGLKTAFDFINKEEIWIKTNLSKPFQILWDELRGQSILSVNIESKEKFDSIQKTRSFYPANSNFSFLQAQLSKHTEAACYKMRAYNLVTNKITFFLKTKNFIYHNFTFNLDFYTDSPENILLFIEQYIKNIYRPGVLYRTTGVILHNLCKKNLCQNDLFSGNSKQKKFEIIHQTIDQLEKKFNRRVICLGSTQLAFSEHDYLSETGETDHNLLFL